MDCENVRNRINQYMENLLSPREAREISDHLASCSECKTAHDELKRASEILKDLDRVEPPPWLVTRIMARIDGEPELGRSFVSRLFRPFAIKIPLQALALVIIAGLSVLVYRENATEFERHKPAISTEKVPSAPQSVVVPAPMPAPGRSALPATAPAVPGTKKKVTPQEAEKARPMIDAEKGSLLVTPPPVEREKDAEFRADKRNVASPPVGAGLSMPAAPTTAPMAEPATQLKKEAGSEAASGGVRMFRAPTERKAATEGMVPEQKQTAPTSGPAPAARAREDSKALLPSTLQSIEEALRSLGAQDIIRKPGSSGAVITATLPSSNVPQLIERLSQYPGVRVIPAPAMPTHEADRAYQAVAIEIPNP